MPTTAQDRSHFAMWCIVSSPLILGHDLLDDAVNDRIWPIITHPVALSISQSYAGHPGGLVRSWRPPLPSPPPTPHLFLWSEESSGNGWRAPQPPAKWSLPAAGTSGRVVHEESGLCVVGASASGADAPPLAPCSAAGAANQTWTLESNGNLHMVGAAGLCLVLAGGTGPAVQVYRCNTGPNEEWTYNSSTGALCSKQDHRDTTGKIPYPRNTQRGMFCLGAQPTPPSGCGEPGQWPSTGCDDTLALWAKPMPGNGVAVLVLNNRSPDAANVSATVTFAELRYSGGAAGSELLEVWSGMKATIAPGATSFSTGAFGAKDCRFYLLTPKTASGVGGKTDDSRTPLDFTTSFAYGKINPGNPD